MPQLPQLGHRSRVKATCTQECGDVYQVMPCTAASSSTLANSQPVPSFALLPRAAVQQMQDKLQSSTKAQGRFATITA